MSSFRRIASVVVAVAMSSAALVAQPTPPAPTTKTPPKTITPSAPTTRPPAGTRASTGPGTQTEDDAYVGVKGTKRPADGVNTPLTTGTPPVKKGAGVSPNNGGVARDGGDDDLNDLEVERRTVQGVNRPIVGAPVPKPTAGTSPNVGRTAPTAPSPTPTGAPLPPRKP